MLAELVRNAALAASIELMTAEDTEARRNADAHEQRRRRQEEERQAHGEEEARREAEQTRLDAARRADQECTQAQARRKAEQERKRQERARQQEELQQRAAAKDRLNREKQAHEEAQKREAESDDRSRIERERSRAERPEAATVQPPRPAPLAAEVQHPSCSSCAGLTAALAKVQAELRQARERAVELEQRHSEELQKARTAEAMASSLIEQADLEQARLARLRAEPDALEALDVEQLQNLEAELTDTVGIYTGALPRIQERLRRAQQHELARLRSAELDRAAELERLRAATEADDDPLCVVCIERTKTHILVPCGHQIVCEGCAADCPKRPCPICRVLCQSVMKVHK